jgi:acyl-[acyl-carrier-protein]-phospholipid O-acyltransferase/long-chain-fatty-acid--[acyl-carrier-protein] ligase
MQSDHAPRLSVAALLASHTLTALARDAAMLVLFAVLLYPGTLPEADIASTLAILAALIALPFMTVSPLAAGLGERRPRRSLLVLGFVLHVLSLGWLFMAFRLKSVPLALTGVLLLSIQAAFVSAAKRGLLKELAGLKRFTAAAMWLEALVLAALPVGVFAGGRFFDGYLARFGGPWEAGASSVLVLIAVGVAALVVFQFVTRAMATVPDEAPTRGFRPAKELWSNRRLRGSAFGILLFYAFGGSVVLSILNLGLEIHGGGAGTTTFSVGLLFYVGIGVLGGAMLASLFSRGRLELGLAPFGAFGVGIGAWLLGIGDVTGWSFRIELLILGFGAGLFLAPLYVDFQNRIADSRRTKLLGALNMFRGTGGMLAAAFFYVTSVELGWGATTQFMALGIAGIAGGVLAVWLMPEHFLFALFRMIAVLIYRVKLRGFENVPAGGALIISNHISYVDAMILQVAFPRKLWFLAVHGPQRRGLPLWFYRVSGVIPISSSRASGGLRLAMRKMKEGELVCMFPEGQVSRTGALMEIRKGFEILARRAEVPVVPVFIDSLWGSIFSYSSQKIIWKLPDRFPFRVLVNVGVPLERADISAIKARRALLDLGEEAYQARVELKSHIARECVKSLARHPWKQLLVDRTADRRALSAGMLLAVALCYSSKIRREVSERRVGIVLPPGAGGFITNLAVTLAEKIPVNLNFTAGRASNESCIRMAEVETVISAPAMREKLPNFPFPESTRDVRGDLAGLGKPRILGTLIMVWLLPAVLIRWIWRVPGRGDNNEAGLLFTSGSSGEPKGVALTHRNILSNCGQISATGILPRTETFLACLPLFHSFGFTVTMWYSMIHSMRAITIPSPLDQKKMIEAIEQDEVSILIGTPTFLRPLLKKAEPQQLRSLRFAVSGAERLPNDLYEAYQKTLGVSIYQGYGLTETTPVASVNVPDPANLPKGVKLQVGHRLGSVGRLVAGMTAKIIDPDTGNELDATSTGMILLKGPNVFNGYLNDPQKSAEALAPGGWFLTGDLARFDDDGFLFIEGRQSRFSKIGGEMVPHVTIEQRIVEVMGIDAGDAAHIVVMGVPDVAKGEALVLLTAIDIDSTTLREKLAEAGLPNLWIPKIVRRVDAIPFLGSGKVDLKACKKLAIELARGSGG